MKLTIPLLAVVLSALSSVAIAADSGLVPEQVALEVDRLIQKSEEDPFGDSVDDASFLRRVTLDITGRPATAGEATRFGLNPAQEKRSAVVRQLLSSDEYGQNWARYWRDAILLRATNMRVAIVRDPFEQWMTDQLNNNRSWNHIVTDLLTATGSVNEDGATALFFAHEGEPEEVAAEASRLFLGIQVQCANCHDHPWDRWKRDEFHEFAAFFPRVQVRRDPQQDDRRAWIVASMNREQQKRPGVSRFLLTRLDRNNDEIISASEVKKSPLKRLFNNERIRERVDTNADGKLTIQEILTAQPADNNRPGRGAAEHYMPNLEDPAAAGTKMDPVFFLGDRRIRTGAEDLQRRQAAAKFITARGNDWFSKAIVNRIWTELTSAPFYAPVDDIGPDREAEHEAALELLADGFRDNSYDLKWLFRTITATQVYQRGRDSKSEGFVALQPARLRSDQLYATLCQTLSVSSLNVPNPDRRRYRGGDRGRTALQATFGFDPSTSRDDVSGSIPQALLLMNSPQLNQLIDGRPADSTVGRILRTTDRSEDAVAELYLVTLGREPGPEELATCLEFLNEADSQREGLEDILWALLNSTEFLTKR